MAPAPRPVVTPPPPPPPPPPPEIPKLSQIRFLAFGDSLTYGIVHLTAAQLALDAGIPASYPFKLQGLLAQRYTDQQPVVLNAGQGGERASAAAPRLRSVMNESVPDVVLLFHGANDLLALGEEGIPGTVDAMEDLVHIIKSKGAIPVILLQPPQREGHPKAAAAPFLERYNNDLRRVAAVQNIAVIDLYSQFAVALQGPDGLHPSDAGYTRIAEIVFDGIKSLFEVPAGAANPTR